MKAQSRTDALPARDVPVFPCQSSVLDETALLCRVVTEYSIPPADWCRFLSRGAADVYRVRAGGANYYLKISRPPRELAHAESEAIFVSRLAQDGLPVVRAIPRRDGAYATEVLASEGPRPILLFEEAPPPLSREPRIEQMEMLGETVARLHSFADSDRAPYAMPVLDVATIEQDQADAIERFCNDEDSKYMRVLLGWLRLQLASIPRVAPEWGICHADLVLSNLRDAANGVALLDFGNLSRTYRGFDLAVISWSLGHRSLESRPARWQAVLRGYGSIRLLPDRLEERLPEFLAMRELSFLGGNAVTLPLRLGAEPFESQFMQEGFERIRSVLSEYGASL